MRQVTVPARPYLGLSRDDERDIFDLAGRYITGLIQRNAPGGA